MLKPSDTTGVNTASTPGNGLLAAVDQVPNTDDLATLLLRPDSLTLRSASSDTEGLGPLTYNA